MLIYPSDAHTKQTDVQISIQAALRTQTTKRLVMGLLEIHHTRLLFLPQTLLEQVSVRYYKDIELIHITSCSKKILENKPHKSNIQIVFMKPNGITRVYNFIVSTEDVESFYPILAAHQTLSQEVFLENTLNLDHALAEQSSEKDEVLTLIDQSSILQTNNFNLLYKYIPTRHKIYNLKLLYTSTQDGKSLNTFYNKAFGHCPTLLVIKDTNGHVFGYYATEEWSRNSSYYGTGESFLWSLLPQFHVYQWTKKNTYFQYSNHECIFIGGGTSHLEMKRNQTDTPIDMGYYGLSLDGNLSKGTSHTCDTYLNRTLSATAEFAVESIELWCFTSQECPFVFQVYNI
jgi:hypothetical protein